MILPGSFCGAQAMFCGYFHAAVHEDCSCRCPKERKTFYEPNWTCTRDALIHRWEGTCMLSGFADLYIFNNLQMFRRS